MVELARQSSDRQTKVAACELLHSLTLYTLGRSAQQPGGQQNHQPMDRLYRKLFPALLSLACDVEQVGKARLYRCDMELVGKARLYRCDVEQVGKARLYRCDVEQIGKARLYRCDMDQVGEAGLYRCDMEQVGKARLDRCDMEQVGKARLDRCDMEQVGKARLYRCDMEQVGKARPYRCDGQVTKRRLDDTLQALLSSNLLPVWRSHLTYFSVFQVCRQLFEPLMMQLIHWFTGNKMGESPESMSLLDSIFDGLVQQEDTMLRDFCARSHV